MTPEFPPAACDCTRRAIAGCAAALMALAVTAGCTPEPPEKERPPEPQAQHTQLRDAIQAPIDRARQVEADTQKAAEAQREAIDAATGG